MNVLKVPKTNSTDQKMYLEDEYNVLILDSNYKLFHNCTTSKVYYLDGQELETTNGKPKQLLAGNVIVAKISKWGSEARRYLVLNEDSISF